MFCSFGCGRKANKQFKNGNLCCEQQWQKCPAVKDKVTKWVRDHKSERSAAIKRGKAKKPEQEKQEAISKQKATVAGWAPEQKASKAKKVMLTVLERNGVNTSDLSDAEIRNQYGRIKAGWFDNKSEEDKKAISRRRCEMSKKMWKKEALREKIVKSQKESWSKYSLEEKQGFNFKAVKTKVSIAGFDVDTMSDCEIIEAYSLIQKQQWENMSEEQQRAKIQRIQEGGKEWRDGLTQEQRSAHFEKCGLQRFKLKPYSFPSGKSILLQGYEWCAIDLLLESGTPENEIIAGAELDLRISYKFNGATHLYYPDIFIPSKNMIVEVKSNYTLSLDREMNEAKRLACIEQGYVFEFWIIAIKRGKPVVTIR